MFTSNLVLGNKPVWEAIVSGKAIDKLFLDKAAQGPAYQQILRAAHTHRIPYSRVPTIKLNKMTSQHHQGVVALLSPIPLVDLSHIVQATYEQGQLPLIVVLDGVTDVGNLGAIIRTAVCVGAHALVVPMQRTASLGGAAMKTSAGALVHLPICRENSLQASIKYLKASGLQVIACHEKTSTSIYQTNLTLPTALLLGAEDQGIQPKLLESADKQAAIPMVGPIGSLNVSVAAAVILYESYRQRNISM